MFDLLPHLIAKWHLWMFAGVIGLIALNYATRFVARTSTCHNFGLNINRRSICFNSLKRLSRL